MAEQDHWGPTLVDGEAVRDQAPTLTLIVIGEGPVLSLPLDGKRTITVGRTDKNDVQISHSSVSREHAKIHVEEQVSIEDLGSGNGTRVEGEKIEPHQPVVIEPRQLVEVGSAILLLQERFEPAAGLRLLTHGYFEAIVGEWCATRPPTAEFAVIRTRVQNLTPDQIRDGLTRALAPLDRVALYAPGEYEILIEGSDTSATTRSLKRHLTENLAVGISLFPKDGRTPDALLGAASQRIRRSEGAPRRVVEDPAMRDLYVVVERLARGKISVLLLGETGVGKEVFAEAIHAASPRAEQPFVRLNCAAFSETLLESELFGYEEGAFTGAAKAKPGLLEVASGGTVFLDELGEMSAATQAKLLRVIEQRQVLRVGGLQPRAIDVRFVSATNRNLEQEVREGRFREDLYYRLDGVTLRIPPLRERKSEILQLCATFLEEISKDLERTPPRLSGRARELLLGYAWPGNLRELKNVMERAALLCTGEEILAEHLPVEKMQTQWEAAPQTDARLDETKLQEMMDAEERRKILEALDQCGGNQTRAAELLGMSRRTLSKRLNKYGVPRPRKQE